MRPARIWWSRTKIRLAIGLMRNTSRIGERVLAT